MSTLDELNKRGVGTLPGLIGLTILDAEEGSLSSRLDLRNELMAPNGYLHAATVVALADTSCGVPGEARARWPHDSGVGRNRFRRGERQADSPLPMHADDPVSALNAWRCEAVLSNCLQASSSGERCP
jgi:hypothetical protein